jgi:excisionase family DNA binding protein
MKAVVALLSTLATRGDNRVMSDTNDSDELLTIAEVAARLRISARTVERKLEAGRELRGVRIGRVWRIFASSVRALLAGETNMRAAPGFTMSFGGGVGER